jgi:peptidoglycan/xylan/chitin deacetylase (PgdA/CDA1 family)
MRSALAALKARVDTRLARHFRPQPYRLPPDRPMVSFTFDDIPASAASVGAPLIEDHGGRATFYVAGGLLERWSGHWQGAGHDQIRALHRAGHEIACHTFSHPRASERSVAAMAAEIEANRSCLESLDRSIRLENFAYPYGIASPSHKPLLAGAFRSARGILPGVNRGVIDLLFLRATPLISAHLDRDGVDRALDETLATGGWLIFYSHDVADSPSPTDARRRCCATRSTRQRGEGYRSPASPRRCGLPGQMVRRRGRSRGTCRLRAGAACRRSRAAAPPTAASTTRPPSRRRRARRP